jgi:hypothetical protein
MTLHQVSDIRTGMEPMISIMANKVNVTVIRAFASIPMFQN